MNTWISKWWDFGRKQGGLYVFPPTITADNGNWYRGTADAIYQNLDFLKNAMNICDHHLRWCDLRWIIIVLEYHIAKKASGYYSGLQRSEWWRGCEKVWNFEAEWEYARGKFEEKPMMAKSRTVSTGIYIIRRHSWLIWSNSVRRTTDMICIGYFWSVIRI